MMDHIELSFVTENTPASKLIRWFTHSDYSHVDIITKDGYRLGARHDGGVRIRPMNYADFTRDARLIIPGYNCDEADEWLFNQVGKPYDIEGLLRSFVLGAGRSVPWWDERQWWCSELATVYTAKATKIRCATPANKVSPNDAYIFGGALDPRNWLAS